MPCSSRLELKRWTPSLWSQFTSQLHLRACRGSCVEQLQRGAVDAVVVLEKLAQLGARPLLL